MCVCGLQCRPQDDLDWKRKQSQGMWMGRWCPLKDPVFVSCATLSVWCLKCCTYLTKVVIAQWRVQSTLSRSSHYYWLIIIMTLKNSSPKRVRPSPCLFQKSIGLLGMIDFTSSTCDFSLVNMKPPRECVWEIERQTERRQRAAGVTFPGVIRVNNWCVSSWDADGSEQVNPRNLEGEWGAASE